MDQRPSIKERKSNSVRVAISGGCVGIIIGGITAPTAALRYYIRSITDNDVGGPLTIPIIALFSAFAGAAIGAVLGPFVSLILQKLKIMRRSES